MSARFSKLNGWMVLLVASLCLSQSAALVAQFSPAGWRTSISQDISIPEPAKREKGRLGEFIQSAFLRPLPSGARALNVDAMEEVPDSSWFTNRIHTGRLSPQDVARGSALHPPPDFSGQIMITRAKPGGVTPGFVVKDRAGVTWFLKFDPPQYPEMTTAAEVISSRIFWAAGYNVPEEWISAFHPSQLRLDSEAFITLHGQRQPMTQDHVDRILQRAYRRPDGAYRVVASRLLPGKLKGDFGFQGKRPDDPNDLVPHEHRRELRGLRVVCAWVNHEDIKSGNTVSSYIEEGGRKFLRHYLWDFGSTLGSDGVRPNVGRAGNAHAFDYFGIKLATLGLWEPSWERAPAPVRHASIGRFDRDTFQPERWRPTMPNYAFGHMTEADGYWAARIVAAFHEQHIRAAVRAGELSDPEAEEFLVKALLERRGRILQRWFTRVTPLADFVVEELCHGRQEISFRDLALEYGLASSDRPYTYQFFYIHQGRRRALSEAGTVSNSAKIDVTPELFAAAGNHLKDTAREEERLIGLQIRAGAARPAHAYFVFEGPEKGLRLVGMRHGDGNGPVQE